MLVLGGSTGYGLASRIVFAFGAGANTLNVSYEKEPTDKKTASPGWYNTRAFERIAHEKGLYAASLNGDAFSQAIKDEVISLIKQNMGKVDLVVYSLASPRRIHPITGEVFNSVLKTIGQPYTTKTVDPFKGEVKDVLIEPASEDEIRQTIAVMGGEDWTMWMEALLNAGVLSDHCKTVAYSYVGLTITYPVYKEGTIGRAKDDLHQTAKSLNQLLAPVHGEAVIAVNKAIVTQASAAIPVVPLYISLLYKVMKARGNHEGAIEQMVRLYHDKFYVNGFDKDEHGYIRMDDWELAPDIQEAVLKMWPSITTENLESMSDIAGYREDFEKLFGFHLPGVDYAADVSPLDI